jgi:hypothetical protein
MAISDLGYPEVTGHRSARLRMTRVAVALLRVLALVDPFKALLRPAVAARVLR